ncbi:MAG: TatD family hydrolase [Anaerolineaceae bacterium]|nr:TatD family hydrolase [Anaerolineaceae bacterium]
MFDTHCHLDLPDFDEDRSEVIRRAENTGFTGFMVPGIEIPAMPKIISMAEEFPSVYFASGVHPNNAADLPKNWADAVRENAGHPRCRAIGEIGLDYYREYCPHEIQREVLSLQLELAGELHLPVIIHCRSAYEDLWPILSSWILGGHGRTAVFHAFDETSEAALKAVEIGMKIGMGGPYTYKKKNERRMEILNAVPLESILLETDCPYLSPIPHRGERNEPSYAALTLAKIAEVKNIPFEEADIQTTLNAREFFRLDEGNSGK